MESVDEIKDIIVYSEINGENIISLLATLEEDELSDYIKSWKERVCEEMRSRIETGVTHPLKYLTWFPKGKGWNKLDPDDVPF